MGCFRLLGIDCRYPVLLEQAQRRNPSTAYLGYCLVQQPWWYLLRIMRGRLHVVLCAVDFCHNGSRNFYYSVFLSVYFAKKRCHAYKPPPTPPDVILTSFWQKHIFDPSLISTLVFCGTSGFLSQNVQLKKIIKSTISSSKNPQEEKIRGKSILKNINRPFYMHLTKDMEHTNL